MIGKTTFMIQNAMIVIMAQAGLYVPAKSATIGLVDRIFCRIGATDMPHEGLSTFMTEMIETANIVNNASNRSLAIVDEIGRGTQAKEGVAIAAATLKYIAHNIKCRTLFATHFYELISIAQKIPSIALITTQTTHTQTSYKITPGYATYSMGINIAQKAGMPDAIIGMAKEILEENNK